MKSKGKPLQNFLKTEKMNKLSTTGRTWRFAVALLFFGCAILRAKDSYKYMKESITGIEED